MYTSPDDARSDLFMSVGVYLLGPIVIQTLFSALLRIGGLGPALAVVVSFATTALVPLLLMRYRGETFADYGISRHRLASFGVGALAMVPVVVATVAVVALAGSSPVAFLPVQVGADSPVYLAGRLVQTVGAAFLAGYATVKARDAFRSDPRTIRHNVTEIGRVIVIAMLVSIVLVVLGGTLGIVTAVLVPVGVVAALALALQSVRGPSATSRAVLLTPTVVLALSVFGFSLDGRQFFATLFSTTLSAAVGLIIGIHTETRNSLMAALGVGLVAALFTGL